MSINNRDTRFPEQKLSIRRKNTKWREASIDSIIARENFTLVGDKTLKEEMQIAYDLYNGVFNEEDLKYVTNPYKVDEGFPASPHNFNIIRPKINLLEGEETKRPSNFKVTSTSHEAASHLQDKAKEMLTQYVSEEIGSQMQGQQGDEDNTKLNEILNYLGRKYYSPAEKTASNTLKYLEEKLNLRHEFYKAWKDALIAGREVYYVGILNGEPTLERMNPLYFSCDDSPEIEFIEDGDWALYHTEMTPSSIYDRFYDIMDESDLDKVLEMAGGNGTGSRDKLESISNSPMSWRTTSGVHNGGSNTYDDNTLDVYHGVWKSYKKVGFLTYLDEDGNEQVEIVDETYEADIDEAIEWEWLPEVWEGYRIGDDLYIGIDPIANQNASIDEPQNVKLPYTGVSYSNTNSIGKSLVQILEPYQKMYITIWYKLELAIARDKGKVINMDITQIPKSMGMDVNKWMHYLTALGVNFVNPHECFSPDTGVIMEDGLVKPIKDIKIGDYVMGLDGTSRKVLDTHDGIDHMYRLKHRSGASDQVVNSAHKNYYYEKNYYNNQYVPQLKNAVDLIDEQNTKSYKSNIRYTKRANDVDLKWNSDIALDPYLLGLWLGDGSTGRVSITNIDPEVTSWLDGYANENGLNISMSNENPNSEVQVIRLFKGSGIKNPIADKLKEYNIFYNKDIPKDYIYTSRKNRLELLAGLIDTDGCYHDRDDIYTFSQCESRKHIVEKAAFIARSLGFKCSVKKHGELEERYLLDGDNVSICQPTYKLSILNWDVEIPTRIERKKSNISIKKGHKDFSNFKIDYEGVGDYNGITIDGDHLFLLDDFTIVHNSGWDVPGREGGKPSSFNQMSSVDLTMSSVIAEYIGLMDKIEELAGELSGISRQRQGAVTSSELVGNVQRSVIQSSHITEPLFWMHNQAKRRAYNLLLNTAKVAWKNSGKEKLHYVLDDVTRIFMNISDDFLYSDFDIFVTDSTKEQQNIESLKTLMQPAMQNGASLLDVAEIMTLDNMSEIKERLETIEDKRQQMQEQQSQADRDTQQQIQQMISQDKAEDNRIKEEDSIRKADTAIQVALIGQEGNEEPDMEGMSLDSAKLDLQRSKQENDTRLKEMQLQEGKRSSLRSEEQKQQEIEIKRKQANKPTTTAK